MRSKRAWMGVSFLVGLRQKFKKEINLIDACETSAAVAAAWHNQHLTVCDGAMRTISVVVVSFLFVQRDEITFWGVKMMSENCLICQKWKVGVHKTTDQKSREQRPVRFHCTPMHKCNENSIFGMELALDGYSHSFWSIWYVHCTIFVCFSVCSNYYMTMAYDDLLIVTIFYSLRPCSICSQSVCKCLEFTLPTTVLLENICKAQCCSRAVMHFR